jgi:hypothetical protein
MTKHLQRVMEQVNALPDEQQERLARLLESLLEQPPVSSGVVRPEVMEAAQVVDRGARLLARQVDGMMPLLSLVAENAIRKQKQALRG